MVDDFEFLEGLPAEQAQEVARVMLEVGRQRAQALQNPQPQGDPFEKDEAAELEQLRASGVRGPNFALQKKNITAKYSTLRKQQPAPVDAEIEKVKDNPREL